MRAKKCLSNEQYILLAYLLVCLSVAVLEGSRSFLISYLVSFAIICQPEFPLKVSSWIKKIFIGSVIIILICLIFFIKSDSTWGRVLIYKLTIQMIRDNLWHGVGAGRFGMEYLEYQYRYFHDGKNTMKELLLADNTKHAFNDYLQIWAELGLLGFFFVVMSGILYIVLVRTLINIKPLSTLNKIAAIQSMSIAIAALFTHVFEHTIFQIAFAISVSQMIISICISNRHIYYQILQVLSCLLIFWWALSDRILNYQAYSTLSYAGNLQKMGYTTDALQTYEDIKADFMNNVIYLSGYAEALHSQGKFLQEQKILKHLTSIDNASIFHIRLARSFKRTGFDILAEQEYIKSVYTVPNRFVPRQELMDFYISLGEREQALKVGFEILRLPVKIKSETTGRIINITKNRVLSLLK